MPGGEVLRFDLPPTAAVANLTGAATGIRRMVARPPAESTATVIDTETGRPAPNLQIIPIGPGWRPAD